MAKCKYWKKASCSLDATDAEHLWKKFGHRNVNCPKNIDDNCDIKPRMVTVKAYAIVCDDGRPIEAHVHKLADRLAGMNVISCTITYKEPKKWK
jgi:hypothetical protein